MLRIICWKIMALAIYSAVLGALWAAQAFGQETQVETPTYRSEYVQVEGPNAERIGQECDAIVKRLETRYGKPRYWRTFPVRYAPGRGGSVAGYTTYVEPNVTEIAIFQSFEESRGGSLDHEMTHAFFFYYLQSNFDLLLNEGLAQNSEYRGRERLREETRRRFCAGEFVSLSSLYGLNRYDRGLLIYTEGFSVVDFLIARGGSKWFAEFMVDLVDVTRDVNRSLRRFYGYESLKELERDWVAYIQNGQNVRTVRAVTIERKENK